MLARQNAILEAALRAQSFLEQNAALLLAVDEGETAKQRHLRRKLRRELMAPIDAIARLSLRDVREFKLLQMPKPSVRGRNFILSARGMADAAAVHRDSFLAYGLPATFLDDFDAAIRQLEDSITERNEKRLRRSMATHHLGLAEKHGRTVLRVLDALVSRAAGDKEPLLRSWRAARRIDPTNDKNTTPTEAA